jgi:uncharacterized protein YodC (DUF2158 family)
MAFEPGDVVFLKSGGQPLTVVAVDEESIECLWLGEEGELFRDTIPSIALTKASEAVVDEDEADENDQDDEDAGADETVPAKRRA